MNEMPCSFPGVITTPMTPFAPDQQLMMECLDDFVSWQVANGVSHLFVQGSWGAGPLLSLEESRLVMKGWCDSAHRHGAKVIVTLTRTVPQENIDIARYAESIGVDALSATSPLYYSADGYYRDDDILNYFEWLLRSVDLPVYLYNNPRTVGLTVGPKLVARLALLGLRGVKDGTKDPGWLVGALSTVPAEFEILSGNTVNWVYAIPCGVRGVMSGTAVCFPELARDAYQDLMVGGNGATHKFQLLVRASQLLGRAGKAPLVSYGLLRHRGILLGGPRFPWPQIADESIDSLAAVIAADPDLGPYFGRA